MTAFSDMLPAAFWTGKRVTVTGGAGFLGRHIVKRLSACGAEVFTPHIEEYDLTEPGGAARMYRNAAPEILIHAAGRVGGIDANRKLPGEFFYENIALGIHVMEEGRKYGGLDKLVVIGSACSYPKFAPTPLNEDHLWSGYPEETNAPYAVAKRALLSMAWSYREQYDMNIVYLVCANLYGCHDYFGGETSHVIPSLISRFVAAGENGDPEVVAWGTGRPSREFLYVEDAAEGVVLAAEHYEGAEPVNLGSGQEVKIRDLVELISRLVGYEGKVVWDTSKPDGQLRRQLDSSRARDRFGFDPQTPLEDGLRRTIAWYIGEQGRTS